MSEQTVSATFRIVDINYLSFSISPPNVLEEANIDVGELRRNPNTNDLNYTTSIQLSINDKTKIVGIKISVKGFIKKGKKEVVLTTSEMLCDFEIVNFDEAMPKKKGAYVLDGIAYTTFYGLAYSTLRGMMKVKLTGTYLEKAILPVINPAQIAETTKLESLISSKDVSKKKTKKRRPQKN